MYVAMFVQFIGTAIAAASWLFLLLSLMTFFALWAVVIVEERTCLEKYGDAYREYMERTPRWIGIPKSEIK
jgi:protein-S-isoprenylcysteine O-methyltransferase Ste14